MAFAGAPFADSEINTITAGEQEHPTMAGLAGGGHVVVWASTSGQDGSGAGVYAQIVNGNGKPVVSEFRVNTTTADSQDFPDVAALANGDFVVVWTSTNQDGSFDGLYMQRFSATGAALGVETLVNTAMLGSQSEVQVSALSTGGYAVAWADYDDPASVRMQIYDAAGLAQGGEITVATLPEDHFAWQVDVTELASGRLAVVWADAAGGTAADDPYFQLVRANGNLVGGPLQMNTTPGTHATQTQVAALPGGGFLAVWSESIGATGAVGVGDARIVGRIYDNAGVAVTGEFTISNGTTGLRHDPQVTLGGDGHVYVGWLEQTGNGEVYVMRAVDETGALQGEEFCISDMPPFRRSTAFWTWRRWPMAMSWRPGALGSARWAW